MSKEDKAGVNSIVLGVLGTGYNMSKHLNRNMIYIN